MSDQLEAERLWEPASEEAISEFNQHLVHKGKAHIPKHLPEHAKEVFSKIQTTEDVCRNVRRLGEVLIYAEIYPHMDMDCNEFELRTNHPVFRREVVTYDDRVNLPEGHTHFAVPRKIQMSKRGDDGSSNPAKAMDYTAEDLGMRWISDYIGSRDLMKGHIAGEGFDEELAKRLGIEVVEVRRVVSLVMQAIEGVEQDELVGMESFVHSLMGDQFIKPDYMAMPEEFINGSPSCSKRYSLLEWMKMLDDEGKIKAAHIIIERMKELAKSDDDLVARNLTRFSTLVGIEGEIVETGRVHRGGVISTYDHIDDFLEEIDALWSCFMGGQFEDTGNTLRDYMYDLYRNDRSKLENLTFDDFMEALSETD